MSDETFARGHADGADQVIFRARLGGRRSAVATLALLVVVASATVAAGASRYLPGAGTGAGSTSESSSALRSLTPSPVSTPAPSLELAPPITDKPSASTPTGPAPGDMVAWTDATPLPVKHSPSVTARPDPWLAQVEVTDMELPAYAVAGKPMRYSILLTNGGDKPVSLSPCPGYKQSIFGMPDYEEGSGVVYLLNCPAIGPVIAPGQSFHLAMVYQVPEATPAGRQLFFWVCDAVTFRAAMKAEIEIRAS
jgi:hypothetical protein